MVNRIFKQAFFAGAILAAASHADSCKEINLYDGSSDVSGHMEESSRTFPEAPEWKTNWGDFDNMKSPYIRLSGTKNYTGDWKGALKFENFPITLNGGEIRLKVRSSQTGKFGVWLSGTSGTSQIYTTNILADSTYVINIPASKITGNIPFSFDNLWIGLFDVPTYQYTNLFVDDILVTCGESQGNTQNGSENENSYTEGPGTDVDLTYEFSKATPSSPIRENIFSSEPLPHSKARYSLTEQASLQSQTNKKFVLNAVEHQQIQNILKQDNVSPQKSRNNWYNALFIVNRNRLQDSVIANPKNIFLEADAIAANYEMQKMPLLVADLDYSYLACADSLCKNTFHKDYSLLMAGLPSSYTHTSKITIVYDPYFVVSTRETLPSVEICTSKGCQILQAYTEQVLEFESAGLQKIIVKMNSNNTSIQQTLFMEVK